MNTEPSKRAGKLRGKPVPKARRGKEKDDFDWRSDPVKPNQTTSLLSGYKSVKHRWACKYKEQQKREMMGSANGGQEWEGIEGHMPLDAAADFSAAYLAGSLPITKSEPSSHPMQPESPEISEVDVGPSDGAVMTDAAGHEQEISPTGGAKDGGLPRWNRSGVHAKAKRINGVKDREEEVKAGVKKQRRKAHEELEAEREERAKHVTAASLANESLQVNVRRTQMQAENELALAAEDDRGTQAANSLRRELRGREGPDPLEESNSQEKRQNRDARAQILVQDRPGSANRSKQLQNKGQAKTTRQQSLDKKRAAASPEGRKGSHVAEDTAETNAGAVRKKRQNHDNISPLASSKGHGQSADEAINGVSTAEDAGVLTRVVLLEGDEKEHLGELDLHQLDSFKDLWRTMRAAYARLPKGDLRIVYKDVDNDLMQLQDEPWPYFKSIARGLFLMKPKNASGS